MSWSGFQYRQTFRSTKCVSPAAEDRRKQRTLAPQRPKQLPAQGSAAGGRRLATSPPPISRKSYPKWPPLSRTLISSKSSLPNSIFFFSSMLLGSAVKRGSSHMFAWPDTGSPPKGKIGAAGSSCGTGCNRSANTGFQWGQFAPTLQQPGWPADSRPWYCYDLLPCKPLAVGVECRPVLRQHWQ